ncbi:MAG TPA: SPOR domain-containing protein [Nitrospirota bacterium]|nr:SPOR domain-containing protein [Nitrospirota bacterium]
MNNQTGGIISKLFIIPAGVALMVGFFFLGYYVGKYQSKSGVQGETMPPLPEVVSNKPPKQEEFTFYKTLTDKENKTVSIDLNPKSVAEEKQTNKKQAVTEGPKDKGEETAKKDIKIVVKAEKEKSVLPSKQLAIKQSAQLPVETKKETTSTHGSSSKLRYTIQIAAYQEKEMAEDDVKKMKTRGYAAFILSSTVPDKGTWYRVRLGSFPNKAAAEKLQKQLQVKEGISSFITIE